MQILRAISLILQCAGACALACARARVCARFRPIGVSSIVLNVEPQSFFRRGTDESPVHPATGRPAENYAVRPSVERTQYQSVERTLLFAITIEAFGEDGGAVDRGDPGFKIHVSIGWTQDLSWDCFKKPRHAPHRADILAQTASCLSVSSTPDIRRLRMELQKVVSH